MPKLSIRNREQRGFTLIELLVVIAIIAVLVAIGVTAFGSARESANISRQKALLNDVANALGQYKVDNGAYPLVDSGGSSVEGSNVNQSSGFESTLGNYLTNQDLPDDIQINYWVDDTGSQFCLVTPLGQGNEDQANCDGGDNPSGSCNFASNPDPITPRWCVQSRL